MTSSEGITSALPAQNGLLWIVTKTDGVVLTLNMSTGAIRSMKLGDGATGEIENSFATDQHGGVYIATNRKLYRFTAGRNGAPKITWQVTYPNSGEHKIGQVDDGTGTTPLVMPGGYVSITDNADPMDIVVYRTRVRLKKHQRRLVCRVPVFSKGASATENSLIGAGRAMIVENNYGYQDPTDVGEGKLTAPGFTRVDLNRNGKGCHVVWTNTTERAPSVVPKVSLANGLIYTYTKEPGDVGSLVLDDARLPHRTRRLQAVRRLEPVVVLQQQLRRDPAQPQGRRVPGHAGRADRAARQLSVAHFSSADVLPSSCRAMISSWICWVPSNRSRIFASRAHFSSSSPSP